jgi:ankyrin repeat protein
MTRRTGTFDSFRHKRTRELLKPRMKPVEEPEIEPICGAKMRELDKKLFLAAMRGDVGFFRKCHAKGARLDALDTNGLNPFMWACATGRENIFDFCISSGIDIDERDKFGNTALDIAIGEMKMQQATENKLSDIGEKLQAIINKLNDLGAKSGKDMLARSG